MAGQKKRKCTKFVMKTRSYSGGKLTGDLIGLRCEDFNRNSLITGVNDNIFKLNTVFRFNGIFKLNNGGRAVSSDVETIISKFSIDGKKDKIIRSSLSRQELVEDGNFVAHIAGAIKTDNREIVVGALKKSN